MKLFKSSQVPTAFLCIATAATPACGTLEEKGSDSQGGASEELPAQVLFSGCVQRAFALKVNGVSFNDSEHFYTRFIPDLILSKPEYAKAFQGAKVEVEGRYGLDTFGANTGVYLSATGGDGHLYQAVTDTQGKFSVTVEPKALNGVFKARVVLRIGLSIRHASGSQERFCYLLHGERSGIRISDSTKPIIFSDFKTQLNTYECEKSKEEDLLIPSTSGTSSSEPLKTSTEDAPREVVPGSQSFDIELPLDENEQTVDASSASHASALRAVGNLDEPSFTVIRPRVRNTDTGLVYSPVFTVSKVPNSTEWRAERVGRLQSHSEVTFLASYAGGFVFGDSSYHRLLDAQMQPVASRSGTPTPQAVCLKAGKPVFLSSSSLSRVEPNSTEVFPSPETLRDSGGDYNRHSRISAACTTSDLYRLAFDQASSLQLYRFNLAGVFQEKIILPRLKFSRAFLDAAKLLAFGDSLAFWESSQRGIKLTPFEISAKP